MMIFYYAAVVAGACFIGNRVDRYLGIAYLLAGFQFVWGGMKVYGFHFIVGFPAFLAIATLAVRKEWLLLYCLRVATWVQVVFSLIHVFPWGSGLFGRYYVPTFGANDPYFWGMAQGSMGHGVVAACWFAAMVPLALRYWTLWEVLLFSVMVFLCKSTMGVLALFAVVYMGAWKLCNRGSERRFLLSVLVSGGALLILAAWLFPQVEFFSISGRQIPWKKAYELILQNPFGFGPGSWAGRYAEWKVEYPRMFDFMHSDPLQLVFEIGVGPASLAFFALYRIIEKSSATWACVLFAIFVNSLGGFPLHIPQIGFVFCVALTLGIGKRNENKARRLHFK